MAVEQAAARLDAKLRGRPWYTAVGVARTLSGHHLIVYVKTVRHPELAQLSGGWEGYPVIIRPMGSVRAVGRGAAAHGHT